MSARLRPLRIAVRTADRAALAWRARAACIGADPALFYGTEPSSSAARREREAAAKRICAGCPVRPECAAAALAAREPWGIWGGLTEQERRRLLDRPERPCS